MTYLKFHIMNILNLNLWRNFDLSTSAWDINSFTLKTPGNLSVLNKVVS